MRRVGRAIALLCLLWLVALALGALGVAPKGAWLFGALQPHSDQSPPALTRTPHQPPATHVTAVLPNESTTGLVGPRSQASLGTTRTHGRAASAPGHSTPIPIATPVTTPATTPATTHGRSSTAPGHTKTAPARGSSSTAPGHTKTPTTTTATTPGRSSSAPGHTKTTTTAAQPGNGHAYGHTRSATP